MNYLKAATLATNHHVAAKAHKDAAQAIREVMHGMYDKHSFDICIATAKNQSEKALEYRDMPNIIYPFHAEMSRIMESASVLAPHDPLMIYRHLAVAALHEACAYMWMTRKAD